MTTIPFNRHPAHPFLDVILWIGFMLAAILALLVVLGIVGSRPLDPTLNHSDGHAEGRNT